MLNRATRIEQDASPQSRSWAADHHPRLRLSLLFLVAFTLLVGIIARVGQLQVGMSEDYQARFEQITASVESLPSRDARIVSADGQVLAHDVAYFQVAAHYRWLEEPPDPKWLQLKARSRLPRSQRADREQVEAEQKRVLEDRDRMWRQLAVLAGVELADLNAAREDIQKRIERIVAAAEERRFGRREMEATSGQSQSNDTNFSNDSWWKRAWGTVVTTLTSAPDRGRLDPIIVREQLQYHTIIPEIDLRRGMEIESHPERFPGLSLKTATRRRYPRRDLAAHVVGYRTAISAEALKQRQQRFTGVDPLDYREGDRTGKTGVEQFYERHLHGLRGSRRLYKTHRGEVVRTEIERQPIVRPDLILTIDTRLQANAEAMLDNALSPRDQPTDEAEEESEVLPIPSGGAIVAMNLHSGAILAAASAPRFDLDLLAQGDAQTVHAAQQDPRSPFLPRTIRMTLPPGSVFKSLTAAALLESGSVDPYHEFYCQGYLDDPEHHRCYIFRHFGVGHGQVTLADALSRSCNVYFYSAARRCGPQSLVEWSGRFGIGHPTGVDLPGERGGTLPSLKSGSGRNRRWQIADTLGLAIGQSSLTVTPLQITRAMAAIGNGGYLVTPHIVDPVATNQIASGVSTTNRSLPEPERIPGLSPSTLEQIHHGLVGVVADPQGTGYKSVRLPGVPIAGKTGTAEVGGGKPDHAWFAGYAPADHPQVAFVVVLEHAGSGGRAAGPLAKKLVESLVRLGLVDGKIELAAGEEE